jgi:hypothetical protein
MTATFPVTADTRVDAGAATRIGIEVASKSTDGASLQRRAEPVTMGLPLPRGLCLDARDIALVDATGAERAVQVGALDRWPDGSIRWALVDLQADIERAAGRTSYEIVVGHAPGRATDGPRVTASISGTAVTVDTGAARFSIGPGERFPCGDVTIGEHRVTDASRTGLSVEDADGRRLTTVIDRVEAEHVGTLRTVVRCEGRLVGPDRHASLHLIARLHFFAGSATVRIVLTLRNPRAAGHPGGRWTLGERGSVFLRDASLRIALRDESRALCVRCSPEHGAPYSAYDVPFELYQDSSGGEAWRSANHLNRDREVPNQMRGYRLRAGVSAHHGGLRASPVVSLSSGERTLAVAMPCFWQNFPKAVEADGDAITCRLFPRQYADAHEIQGGEQKTHTLFVAFDRDRVTAVPLDWCRAPLLARADPSWYCSTGALPYVLPAALDSDSAYTRLVNAAIDGDDTFEHKREVIDEYGWRHFGDLYADHEAVFERSATPLISHYNNQYDAIAGCAYQFLRSGNPRWWTLMEEMAVHVTDIDVYHTTGDRARYNRGLFWHTYHYVDADTSGHRTYPRHPKVAGGGPSAEHNYTTGLLLHYFLTGDPQSRETAIDLARWVLAMDDGRKTVFRWLDRGATGVASESGSPLYHGPGRGPGNSIAALIDGHRLTGDPVLLAKAEALIRRCIHPADDVAARNLLDAERRWFYTVFLQSLGKYLDYQAERGALDDMYAYTRASLLHYAEWMADHEYPYLDRPGILEYPTETWAAQDMRKSDVFKYAARHTQGGERERFLARSAFFFHASISQLSGMPTRTKTRPVVLMLTNGLMHAWFTPTRDIAAPAPASEPHDFGTPDTFVPQKVRALKRARNLAAATLLVATALGLLYLLG